jgi:hypothetical protein
MIQMRFGFGAAWAVAQARRRSRMRRAVCFMGKGRVRQALFRGV